MAVLKRIKIYSLAKIYSIMSSLIGLILGLVNLTFFLLSKNEPAYAGVSPIYGYGGVVLFPLIYGITGFVFGASSAYFYNLAAKYIGGIEFDTDKK